MAGLPVPFVWDEAHWSRLLRTHLTKIHDAVFPGVTYLITYCNDEHTREKDSVVLWHRGQYFINEKAFTSEVREAARRLGGTASYVPIRNASLGPVVLAVRSRLLGEGSHLKLRSKANVLRDVNIPLSIRKSIWRLQIHELLPEGSTHTKSEAYENKREIDEQITLHLVREGITYGCENSFFIYLSCGRPPRI